MINKFRSILAGFCLAMMIYAPAVPLQQNTVVKHRGSGTLVFVASRAVAQTSSSLITTISTASPLNVTAGDLLFVVCRASGNVWTATSSPSNTFTAAGTAAATLADFNGYYSFGSAGGSTTFTCSGSNANFASMIVLEYHPGFLTTLDTSTSSSGSFGPSTAPGTPSFNTAAQGLIIACTTIDNDHITFTAGSIGSGSATLRQTSDANVSTGNAGCEDTMPLSGQAAIHGSMTISASQNWEGFAAAFK